MGEQERLGAARARAFEGEIQRLRGRNEMLTRKINYQGKALQAMGDALQGYADAQKALDLRFQFSQLPFYRRWWFAVKAYCRPVWIRVKARDAAEADLERVIEAADVEALEKILGTSLRPMPGDEQLIAEAHAALMAERGYQLPSNLEEEPAPDVVDRAVEAATDNGNLRPFRGKVPIQ